VPSKNTTGSFGEFPWKKYGGICIADFIVERLRLDLSLSLGNRSERREPAGLRCNPRVRLNALERDRLLLLAPAAAARAGPQQTGPGRHERQREHAERDHVRDPGKGGPSGRRCCAR
jgi:hypothetical protein